MPDEGPEPRDGGAPTSWMGDYSFSLEEGIWRTSGNSGDIRLGDVPPQTTVAIAEPRTDFTIEAASVGTGAVLIIESANRAAMLTLAAEFEEVRVMVGPGISMNTLASVRVVLGPRGASLTLNPNSQRMTVTIDRNNAVTLDPSHGVTEVRGASSATVAPSDSALSLQIDGPTVIGAGLAVELSGVVGELRCNTGIRGGRLEVKADAVFHADIEGFDLRASGAVAVAGAIARSRIEVVGQNGLTVGRRDAPSVVLRDDWTTARPQMDVTRSSLVNSTIQVGGAFVGGDVASSRVTANSLQVRSVQNCELVSASSFVYVAQDLAIADAGVCTARDLFETENLGQRVHRMRHIDSFDDVLTRRRKRMITEVRASRSSVASSEQPSRARRRLPYPPSARE